jgi:hypothetical protein
MVLSLNRRNPKRDANETEIMQAFHHAGCWVTQLSGAGIPVLLVEVKMPGGLFTKSQQHSFEDMACNDVPLFVVRRVEDIPQTLRRFDLTQSKHRSRDADN